MNYRKLIRSRRVAVVLAVASMLAACAGTKLALTDYLVPPDLQSAYGDVFAALVRLDAVQSRLGSTGGSNCRYLGQWAQCIDGGITVNGNTPPESLAASARRGALAYLATSSTIAVCKTETYCPGEPRFEALKCIPKACPGEPEGSLKGCVQNTCSAPQAK